MSSPSVAETAPWQGQDAVQDAVDSSAGVPEDPQAIRQSPSYQATLTPPGLSARRAHTLPQTPQYLTSSNSSPQLKSQGSNGYFSSHYPSISSSSTHSPEKDILVDAVSVLVKRMEEMIDLTRNDMKSRNATKSLPSVAHTPADSITDKPKAGRRPAAWLQKALIQRIERHWIILSVFFMATVVSVSIGVGWAFRLHSFNIRDQQVPPGDAVSLTATLIAIDPVGQTMTMDWFATYPCNATADPGDCPNINIYFDEASLRTGSSQGGPVPSNTKPTPTFFFNATDYYLAIPASIDGRISSPWFRTILAITSDATGRTLQSYPFDKYTSQISVFAQNAEDNSTVSIAIPYTNGLAVGFNAELQENQSGAEDDFGTLLKTIVITRGQVVRVYAILVVAAVWLVTLTFIGACIASVFCGKGLSASVLALPVATLFAFTQLRGTLPGAPDGFGADIDFVGILPCLALLTFCSVFMTAVFLFRDPEVDSARWARISTEYDKAFQAKYGTSLKQV